MGKSRGEGELGDDFSAFEHAALQREVAEGKVMVFSCLPQELSPRDAEVLSKSLRAYFVPKASQYGEQVVRCALHISGRNVSIVGRKAIRSLQPRHLRDVMRIVQKFFEEFGGIKDMSYDFPEPPPHTSRLPEQFAEDDAAIRQRVLKQVTRSGGQLAGTLRCFLSSAAKKENTRTMQEAYEELRNAQQRNFLAYAATLSDTVRTALEHHWGTILGQLRRRDELAELHAARLPCTRIRVSRSHHRGKRENSVTFSVDEKTVEFFVDGNRVVIETPTLRSEHLSRREDLLTKEQLRELLPELRFDRSLRWYTIEVAPDASARLAISLEEARSARCAVRWVDGHETHDEQEGEQEDEEG